MGSGDVRSNRHRRDDRGPDRPLLRQPGSGPGGCSEPYHHKQRPGEQRDESDAYAFGFAVCVAERLTEPVGCLRDSPKEPLTVGLDDVLERKRELDDRAAFRADAHLDLLGQA